MKQDFRRSMGWLHTWAGVVLGSILFAIFWMGTLSVFDSEIDLWMKPTTRLAPATSTLPLESFRPSLNKAISAKAAFWNVTLPNDRDAVIHTHYGTRQKTISADIDPITGHELPDAGTLGATEFIFPFHYTLNLGLMNVGEWVVGVATMAMLALCVTGVIIHRKIFVDFFTFRPRAKPRRMLLDLHNVSGVLGLPFHIILAFSGLVILGGTYFPTAVNAVYPNARAYFFDSNGLSFLSVKHGKPGAPVASLDEAAKHTRALWGEEQPHLVVVTNPGMTTSRIAFFRGNENQVVIDRDVIAFEGSTGKFLSRAPRLNPVMRVQRFLSGVHLIEFRHWVLRWIYFLLGLGSCVLIGTGFLFWLEARRKRQGEQVGFRLVEGIAAGSITGIILATLAFFVANRLLPLGTHVFGLERASLEVCVFYSVWLGACIHGLVWPQRVWIIQCAAIGFLALSAAILNWITTGDHLLRTLSHSYLWPVGGMDAVLLAGATLALLMAVILSRQLRKKTLLTRTPVVETV
ncbi:PepSY-associated TM helix domain-containing protein [Acetobacter sp. AAB5]|uniref:PepSY-associated TM helix domain-containing protein n=1 Tax=Acetobacter sp. AAB5 TaxID=3418370 RepID=UPI003CEB952A